MEAVGARRSRRLLAESIQISVEVVAQHESAARDVVKNLNFELINSEFEHLGPSQATVLSTSSDARSHSLVVIIGASLDAIAALTFLCCTYKRALNLKSAKSMVHADDILSNNHRTLVTLEDSGGMFPADSSEGLMTSDDFERYLPLLPTPIRPCLCSLAFSPSL